MSSPLPPLRRELDIMPSPSAEQPGLLIRDPFQYSNAVIIVPPLLTQGLPLFDGQQTELDLRALLTRLTGDLNVGDLVRSFVDTMRQSGFLECEVYHEMRDRKQRAFAEAGERRAAHAGTAYPAEAEPLRAQLDQYGATPKVVAAHDGDLVPLAAPHVSPEGGFKSYAAAYRRLNPVYAEKTFVVLGTSHYGEPEKFGLTRKPYVTPLGRTETDLGFIDALARAAPGSIVMEDYCHATEHSIEFQCVFLQHVVGNPGVRVVPILCGPLAESLMNGGARRKTTRSGGSLTRWPRWLTHDAMIWCGSWALTWPTWGAAMATRFRLMSARIRWRKSASATKPVYARFVMATPKVSSIWSSQMATICGGAGIHLFILFCPR